MSTSNCGGRIGFVFGSLIFSLDPCLPGEIAKCVLFEQNCANWQKPTHCYMNVDLLQNGDNLPLDAAAMFFARN